MVSFETKEKFKTQLSRSEYRHHIAETYWACCYHFARWYKNINFLRRMGDRYGERLVSQGYKKNKVHEKIERRFRRYFNNVSVDYDMFVAYAMEIWSLIKFYLSINNNQREEYDLKLNQLLDETTHPERIRDIFNDLGRFVKGMVPLEDMAYYGEDFKY